MFGRTIDHTEKGVDIPICRGRSNIRPCCCRLVAEHVAACVAVVASVAVVLDVDVAAVVDAVVDVVSDVVAASDVCVAVVLLLASAY